MPMKKEPLETVPIARQPTDKVPNAQPTAPEPSVSLLEDTVPADAQHSAPTVAALSRLLHDR